MAKSELKGLGNKKEPEVVEEEVEKEPFSKRLTDLRDRFKLGPHHKMERFTVMVSAATVFLLLFTVLSFASHRSDMATLANEQAVLSTDFSFSLSGQNGSVEGVYGDENRTDVMVLFRLDDPANMSANAENYELFITGESEEMSYAPDVSFSLFGTTGYGMVRFTHDAGIANQILDVTLRSNSELADTTEIDPSDLEDGSFAKYDQAQFYVNPGAEEITVLEDVKPGESDPARLYTALVAEPQDAVVREEIATVTKDMNSALKRTAEYENRLVSSGYTAPVAPWFVEGDYIDEDGVFHAAKNVAGAHAIDYANTSVYDGYIQQVAGSADGYSDYIEAQEEKRAAELLTLPEEVLPVLTVAQADGKELDLSRVVTGTSPSQQVAAKDSVDSLVNTWRTYLGLKVELQRDLMMKLLVLDADIQSQSLTYSEHTGDGVATIY